MMNRVLLFLCSMAIIACSNDDDEQQQVARLQGPWNLVKITGGFADVHQDFDVGSITWSFNEVTQKVTIANNSTVTGVYTGLPSGEYSYTVTAPTDIDILVVKEENLGTITLTTTTLVLDTTIEDGFKIEFTR